MLIGMLRDEWPGAGAKGVRAITLRWASAVIGGL